MSKKLTFEFPYPPSVNHMYFRSRKGVFVSAEAKLWRDSIYYANRHVDGFGSGDVGVDIKLFVPDKRRRDIDNILKCTLDVLQFIDCFDDDHQIISLLVKKEGLIPGGKILVDVFDFI